MKNAYCVILGKPTGNKTACRTQAWMGKWQ
jgi:hypothetical protein